MKIYFECKGNIIPFDKVTDVVLLSTEEVKVWTSEDCITSIVTDPIEQFNNYKKWLDMKGKVFEWDYTNRRNEKEGRF